MLTKTANRYSMIELIDISSVAEDELEAELKKGYADILANRTKPVSEVFADIRKDYGICR